MGSQTYPKHNIVQFGRQLVQTGDLDPIYIALNNSGFSQSKKLRWLVAYIAYYHAGSACHLSDYTGMDFWRHMMVAAKNEIPAPTGERWPRAKERRHFRGVQATVAITDWCRRWANKPESMFDYIAGTGGSYEEVASKAKEHYSVGNWLAFKVVDLVDACLGMEVDQSDLRPFLYDTPRESLLRVWNEDVPGSYREGKVVDQLDAIKFVIQILQRNFRGLTIPHKPSKPLDMFCIETVCCKHLSHLHGHYPPLNDLHEIHEGLLPWLKVSKSVGQFQRAMPRV